MTDSLAAAIVGHLVGDYLLQWDTMARYKNNAPPPPAHLPFQERLDMEDARASLMAMVCAIHCVVWASCVMLFAGWPVWGWGGLACFGWLFGTHYFIDRYRLALAWMSMGQEKFRDGSCAPWSAIVVDNTLHLVTLWVACKYLAA